MAMRIMSVVGARPNFMKIAPFVAALKARNAAAGEVLFEHYLVHTGQHYDAAMSESFFHALNIPEPDMDLGIGSGSHAEQVGKTMIAFEQVVHEWRPDWIVVVGDVNATCACSITGAKDHVKVAHIEAGLRSFDNRMPEEINRLVTDRLSDLLFTTDHIADENLAREGVPSEKIKRVGNIMIDTLEKHRGVAEQLQVAEIVARFGIRDAGCGIRTGDGDRGGERRQDDLWCGVQGEESLADAQRGEGKRSMVQGLRSKVSLPEDGFAVLTLHRPSNVDDKDVLGRLVDFFVDELTDKLPLVWTVHPRTRKQLEAFGLWEKVTACDRIQLLEPVGYHEMLRLNMAARIMLTDSGGLQEECCVLGTPCLTLRENTERPMTLGEHGGVSELVGNDVSAIREGLERMLAADHVSHRPPLWDGHTAERIVDVFERVAGKKNE